MANNQKILGVDPGLGGALAILIADGSLAVFDMPVHQLKRGGKNKHEIDRYELARLVDGRSKNSPVEPEPACLLLSQQP